MNNLASIAIIVDTPNWAFDIGAKLIKKELKDLYNVEIFYQKIDDKEYSLFEILEQTKNFDIVHFLWRKMLLQFEQEQFKEEVKKSKKDYKQYILENKKRISTGVYDHLFLNKEEQMIYNSIFNKYSNGYFVCSKRLYNIYSNIKSIPKPAGIIMDTVDGEKFYPQNIKRFDNIERTLNIGWVGNSSWNINDGNNIDYKGFTTILEPVIEDLKRSYNIEGIYADRKNGIIQNDDMKEYYSKIDILVCTSFCEGSPRPILEAIACGVPVISTDIGIVNEILGKKQREYILKERTKEALSKKITHLYKNRKYLKQLSNENIAMRAKHISSARKKLYVEYFDNFLTKKKGDLNG